jgi:DNA-binding response OmpR family regulator
MPAPEPALQPRLAADSHPHEPRERPRLIVAHTNAGYAGSLGRWLHQDGCNVHLVGSGPEARRLARVLAPAVVVLDTDLPEESGWLTCQKLLAEQPDTRVFLLSANPTAEGRRFAAFVGATSLLGEGAGPRALVHVLAG